jgi:hypothetical protein
MKSVSRKRAVPAGFESALRLESLATASIVLLVFLFAFSGAAFANCTCQCVNGELAAICAGNVSVQPTCPPRSCPAPSPNLSMARNQQVSAQGGNGSDCAPRQVLDPISGKYQWQLLCR